MNIKNIANSILIFTINRLIEIFGIVISVIGLILFIALISYSPSDPNFIFSDNTEIKNLLGFQGSYISDFFFQAFGIISFLIPLTYFLSGIKVVKEKKIFFLIENTFYKPLNNKSWNFGPNQSDIMNVRNLIREANYCLPKNKKIKS